MSPVPIIGRVARSAEGGLYLVYIMQRGVKHSALFIVPFVDFVEHPEQRRQGDMERLSMHL